MSDDEPTVDELLDTPEAARETETDRTHLECCSNCETVTESTNVATKERGRGELHYCGECDRLLSTDEYEKWRAIRER